VTFTVMNGGSPILQSKSQPDGRAARLRLLQIPFGPQVEMWVQRNRGRETDVLDAFAMLWTARRVAAGVHLKLPEDGVETDAFGLRAEMVA
jgi:hypothetical protein